MLSVGAGVAGVYWVYTVPEARKQGIGTALTCRVLQEARSQGHRLAILQASAMGQSVYQRLGFGEYCKMGVYVWRS
jgi:GNAT superfamily N-acetyltransferase